MSDERIEFSDEGNAIMHYANTLQEQYDKNFREIYDQLKSIRADINMIHVAYSTKTNVITKIRETEEFLSEKIKNCCKDD